MRHIDQFHLDRKALNICQIALKQPLKAAIAKYGKPGIINVEQGSQ